MLLTASLGADRYVASLTTISDVEVYSDLQVCYLTTIHAINSVRLMMAHRGKDVNPVKFVQASGIANQFSEKRGCSPYKQEILWSYGFKSTRSDSKIEEKINAYGTQKGNGCTRHHGMGDANQIVKMKGDIG
ncbi:IQ-domain [Musa troglodytarum]|uniref:IQ-domain n=1 Tax=Musa troglodytarum TaxID=320322 RepID=A0A9E7KG59_9LILI|nr:IQ-domain [Musa troglodytarum]